MSRAVTVGLIADPGLPAHVAAHLVEDLGPNLARAVAGVEWRIDASRETLPLTEAGEIPLSAYAPDIMEQHGWDAVVYLTDLPRRHEGEPIVAEVSSTTARSLCACPRSEPGGSPPAPARF